MTTFRINDSQTQWTAEHQKSDIGSLRFSPDGKFLAITCFNGHAFVRNASRSRIVASFNVQSDGSPLLAVRWHPKNQDQLIFSSAKGLISSWSISQNKELWSLSENDNTVNSLDISPSGATFATVGSDSKVRVYDTETHKLSAHMATQNYMQGLVTGHTNRVFASLYLDESTVATGGWDNTVIVWDTRSGSVVRSIFGPGLCGNASVL
ncbi:WD-repeat protein [Tritrichomonas foetus]|uniref:WD-repeat protein n=1 Tax=Tritrichomonas foetus TaxID=1144522 RepID=A0A1J4L584_9EUKA|nr:WD-repeat protein [Tritrichomonas foetus]|eukprot:OHT17093.1 WD-repeat protein [Tritrichomonas foetus]